MGSGIGAAVLVIGLFSFVGKYAAHEYSAALVGRAVLVAAAVCVLVAPLEWGACSAWLFPDNAALAGAFIVVASELLGTTFGHRCGPATAASALAFAIANARHDTTSECGALLVAASCLGLIGGVVAFARGGS
ncbi:MAG: hypothetical protein VW491_03145 [Gammaproteobacteria bacterium]